MRQRPAFTLVELLVVIAIVGLLSTVAMVSMNSARDKAKVAKVNADFQQIFKQIEVARNDYNVPLISLGGGCSDCACRTGTDLSALSSSHACITSMASFFSVIGMSVLPRDPWGSPYLMDENEMESGGCATHDALFSAGPNRIDDLYINWSIAYTTAAITSFGPRSIAAGCSRTASFAYIIQILKAKTSGWIKKKTHKFPKGVLWARGYFVSTVGVHEMAVKKYVQNQGHHQITMTQPSLFDKIRR